MCAIAFFWFIFSLFVNLSKAYIRLIKILKSKIEHFELVKSFTRQWIWFENFAYWKRRVKKYAKTLYTEQTRYELGFIKKLSAFTFRLCVEFLNNVCEEQKWKIVSIDFIAFKVKLCDFNTCIQLFLQLINIICWDIG